MQPLLWQRLFFGGLMVKCTPEREHNALLLGVHLTIKPTFNIEVQQIS